METRDRSVVLGVIRTVGGDGVVPFMADVVGRRMVRSEAMMALELHRFGNTVVSRNVWGE